MYGALTKHLLGDYETDAVASANKVLDLARSALKKDKSVMNLGCALFLASQLNTVKVEAGKPAAAGKKTAAAPSVAVDDIFAKVGDALAQADEVDGKVLQFEGGLTTAYLVVVGAYGLADQLGKAPPKLTKMQSVKLGNYFLGHKNARHAKGGYMALKALDALSNNMHQVPVAFTLVSRPYVSESNPSVQIRATDLLGRPISVDVGGKKQLAEMRIESAMRVTDGTVVFSGQKMAPVAGDQSSGAFELDLFKASGNKLGRGFYDLTVSADFGDSNLGSKFAGNIEALLAIKAVTPIDLVDSELRIEEIDGSTTPKVHKLKYPESLAPQPDLLEADRHHKIVLKFKVVDKVTKEPFKVHQAFVRFSEAKSGAEIIYVAEDAGNGKSSGGSYKFEMAVKEKTKDFSGESGTYDIELIVGDAVILNPFKWKVGTVDLIFSSQDYVQAEVKKDPALPRSSKVPQSEIKHIFRQPDVRPPSSVSMAFTVLCLIPILIMFVLWIKLGVNVSGFPFSFSALGFHLGLGAIFGLYYVFWLQMDMFTTVKYLAMVGFATFLCGNSMLSRIAEKRKSAEAASGSNSFAR